MMCIFCLLQYVCCNFFFGYFVTIVIELLLSSFYSFVSVILIQFFCSNRKGFLFFHFLAFSLIGIIGHVAIFWNISQINMASLEFFNPSFKTTSISL